MTQSQAAKNLQEDLLRDTVSEGGIAPLSEKKIPVVEEDDEELELIIKLDTSKDFQKGY